MAPGQREAERKQEGAEGAKEGWHQAFFFSAFFFIFFLVVLDLNPTKTWTEDRQDLALFPEDYKTVRYLDQEKPALWEISSRKGKHKQILMFNQPQLILPFKLKLASIHLWEES